MAKQQYASMNPETFTEGTGLFDDVDGTIVDIQFTPDAPEGYGADGNPLFANVKLLLDGDGDESERTVSQSYSLGGKSGDNYSIGDTGTGLIPIGEHATINKSTKWGTFMEALRKEGVPEPILNAGDMAALVGLKGHFNRTADKERKGLKNQRASKYPQTTLVVTKIIALPGGKAAKVATGSTKTTAPAGDGAAVPDGTLDEAVSQYLLEILASKDGKVQRSQLALLGSKFALAAKDPRRLDIAKRMADEEFLTQNLAWTYDAASKGQLITA